MEDGLLPPIVENEAVCPACGVTYVGSYRQGNVRVSSDHGCPRCAAAAQQRRSRRPPRKSASSRRDHSYGVA